MDQFPCWEGGGSDWSDGINVINVNGVGVGVGVGVLAMTYSQCSNNGTPTSCCNCLDEKK